MNSIKVSKRRIRKGQGVVILPVDEYQRLLASARPTYYLRGKNATDVDKLVAEGLAEYRAGKTIRAASIKQALKKYAAEENKR